MTGSRAAAKAPRDIRHTAKISISTGMLARSTEAAKGPRLRSLRATSQSHSLVKRAFKSPLNIK
jgi:hypothetical protein